MEGQKTGYRKRRVCRKLHLAVDSVTYDIVAAEVSLENVHYAEVLLNPLWRKLGRVYADNAYDSKACHQLIMRLALKRRHPVSRLVRALGYGVKSKAVVGGENQSA